jgi:hypothetical protein
VRRVSGRQAAAGGCGWHNTDDAPLMPISNSPHHGGLSASAARVKSDLPSPASAAAAAARAAACSAAVGGGGAAAAAAAAADGASAASRSSSKRSSATTTAPCPLVRASSSGVRPMPAAWPSGP